MRAGRTRWKIENETINTLKNHGYEFEHNYGHGCEHLSTIMACLIMIAFLIDQIEMLSCSVYKAAVNVQQSIKDFRDGVRSCLKNIIFPDWMSLYVMFIHGLDMERGPPYNSR